jgi:hypothetical protein
LLDKGIKLIIRYQILLRRIRRGEGEKGGGGEILIIINNTFVKIR